MIRVLVTGANGFLGKNLQLHLVERRDVEVVTYTRQDPVAKLPELLQGVDVVFHLAGVNRPDDPAEFHEGNAELTCQLADAVAKESRKSKPVTVLYVSSTQAVLDNPYGKSKRAAEQALFELADQHDMPVHIFRLPNVFGKWCRPNYNSVVATFCHNITRDLPIQISNSESPLTLVYVEDVIARFMKIMSGEEPALAPGAFADVSPQYESTVGALAAQLQDFRKGRDTLMIDHVGKGLARALYATYVSYLPMESFSYEVQQHQDPRGVFVEMLKTPDAGQLSFFTAHPGVMRGGHYHHSKTEKFLVIKGKALFRFRHMQTNQVHELATDGDRPEIVETVPGWAHDITNVGSDEMIVMLWANEIFDPDRPDTFSCPV